MEFASGSVLVDSIFKAFLSVKKSPQTFPPVFQGKRKITYNL